MPNYSVSVPIALNERIVGKGYSPSKLFAMGAEIALKGGLDALKNLKDYEERLEVKQMKIDQMEKTINNLREELAYIRPKLVEKESKATDEILKKHGVDV